MPKLKTHKGAAKRFTLLHDLFEHEVRVLAFLRLRGLPRLVDAGFDFVRLVGFLDHGRGE